MGDQTLLGYFPPLSSTRCCRPVWDTVFRAGIGYVGCDKVREIGHDHDGILPWSTSLPDKHTLSIGKVDVNKLDVVDRQSVMTGAKLYQAGNVVEDSTPHGLVRVALVDQPAEIYRID